MYLRGHSNVAVTSLWQLKKEVWLNSNNAFLHTSKWSKWCVSHLQGCLKRPSFTNNTICGHTGLGRALLYYKMWLPPIEKRDVEAFLVRWDGGGRRGAMQEKAWSHHLLVPREGAPQDSCSHHLLWLYQTQLCDPGESKHVILTPADLCGASKIIHKHRRNHTSLHGRLWVTVSEEILTDISYLFYSDLKITTVLVATVDKMMSLSAQ